jgi:hypothetical protein
MKRISKAIAVGTGAALTYMAGAEVVSRKPVNMGGLWAVSALSAAVMMARTSARTADAHRRIDYLVPKVHGAKLSADNAQAAAGDAQISANAASNTAGIAITNANKAQTDANAASNTADIAITTANAALPKAGGTMTGTVTCSGTFHVTGKLSVDDVTVGVQGNPSETDGDADFGTAGSTYTKGAQQQLMNGINTLKHDHNNLVNGSVQSLVTRINNVITALA